MKKIMAFCISGFIALCFSMSIHAQSTQQDLDQVELMKQFIGTWTAETGVDSTLLWEIIPAGKGYEYICYFKAKGETYENDKGIIGFTQQKKTVTMVTLWQNGWVSFDMGKFVSDKKITFERFTANHSRVIATTENSLLTPDKFDMIFKWGSGEPETWDDANVDKWTFIRINEDVKGQETDRASATQQKFDNIDVWIKTFEDPERDKWQKPEEVVKNLNLKPGDVVADIGAGTGYFTRHFIKPVSPGGRALGLDTEPSMVQYMMEDAHKLESNIYEALLIKPDNPELGPGSVDVVFLCNTYHHIENRVDYFKRLSKSLKKNGRIVIVDFYNKPLPVGPQAVDHKLSKEVVLEEFREAGYKLKHDKDFLPYQYYLEFGL